jgi:hypothetical protein
LIRHIDLSASNAADPRVGGIFLPATNSLALGGGTPHMLAAQGIKRISRSAI